jgi:hypothetical protein
VPAIDQFTSTRLVGVVLTGIGGRVVPPCPAPDPLVAVADFVDGV